MADDSTIVLKDIKSALGSAESEAKNQPPALLIVGGDLNGTLFDLLEKEITAGRNSNNKILRYNNSSFFYGSYTSNNLFPNVLY